MNDLLRQDKSRRENDARKKQLIESTRGYEVNIGFDPYRDQVTLESVASEVADDMKVQDKIFNE